MRERTPSLSLIRVTLTTSNTLVGAVAHAAALMLSAWKLSVNIRFLSLFALLISGCFALCPRRAICQKQVNYTQVVERATPVVVLMSSARTVPWGTSVSFTARLTGSGAPPSGIVTFRNGASQLGVGTLNNSGIATYTIGTLGAGSYPITAAYEGDSNYVPATSSALAISVVRLTPAVTVRPSLIGITTAESLQVTVRVSGGGSDPTPTGLVTLTGGSYTAAVSALTGGLATIDVPAGSLAVGTDTLTVTYTPDAASFSIYNRGSNTALVAVTTVPGFAISGTSVTVRNGAITGNNSTITITPQPGFTGTLALTAAITSSPIGALNLPTLSFGSSDSVVVRNANAATASLTVSTIAAIDAAFVHARHPEGNWHAAAGGVLACTLLFCVPLRKRQWKSMPGLLLLLLTLAGGAIGCGVDTWKQFVRPTTLGTYIVTVTGTSGTAVATVTISVIVE
jgi:hypothetical protein